MRSVDAGPASRQDSRPTVRRLGHQAGQLARELDTVDRAVYRTVAAARTPLLDLVMARLSDAANYSRLGLGCAAVVAAVGGRHGRRAALIGIASIGASSAMSNLVAKPLFARGRPERDTPVAPSDRSVRMPTSQSLPSGHSASAFAFATAVGSELPALAAPLGAVAAAVAYSRVHTGVHYPADTVVGSVLGASVAQIVCRLVAKWSATDRPVATDVI